MRQLTMDLHLRDPRELFTVDDFDPFTQDMTTRAGVEQIKDAALAMKLPERISVTLYLPAVKIKEDTTPMIRAALARYCAYQAREVDASIRSLKREAVGDLKVGGVVLGACLLVAVLLLPLITSSNPVGAFLGATLASALVIVVWVVVWAPIETFFVDPLPLAWERRFLRRLREMDLAVHAESGGSSGEE